VNAGAFQCPLLCHHCHGAKLKASFEHLPEGVEFFLEIFLFLGLFVPVDLAPQLVGEDHFPLHFESIYFLFELVILFLDLRVLLAEHGCRFCLLFQLFVLLSQSGQLSLHFFSCLYATEHLL
jgi:hypothetical protein